MQLRELSQRMIQQKRREIGERENLRLECQKIMALCDVDIQRAHEMINVLEREIAQEPKDAESAEISPFRKGTQLEQIWRLLRESGEPMHVDDMLTQLGLHKSQKMSLTGSLSLYSKRNKVFKAFGKNFFGLKEMKKGFAMKR